MKEDTLSEVKMRILIIFCVSTLAFGAPTPSDEKNKNIEVVHSSERRFNDLYQFQLGFINFN